MRPVDFPESNIELTRPPSMNADECKSLFVHRGVGIMVSKWVPSVMDRLRLIAGYPMWLTVVSDRHPPVRLDTATPFAKD
jgi:hypothetical protein